MERTFQMTGHGRTVINYRWRKGTGLMAEMWRGYWHKSEYTLMEFLQGMNGTFTETTRGETP